MRIYNISRVLAVPFGIAMAFLIYKMFYDIFFDYTYLVIPIGLVLLLLWAFSPQIDYWWQTKYPIKIEPELQKLMAMKTNFYNNLGEDQKSKFDERLSLYMLAKEFTAMGQEKREVPYDIQALIGQIPVHMTLNKKDYLIGEFDRIILYKHPFPSPNFPFLHAMETHVEDGVILFSLQHLQAAINNPSQFYHVGYHAYAEAFIKTNPTISWPDFSENYWDELEKISKFKTEDMLKSVGFESLDILPVAICYYFVFGNKFEEVLPEIKKQFDGIFLNS